MVTRVPIRDALEQYQIELESGTYAESTQAVYMAKLRRFRDIYEAYQRERRHIPYVCSIDPAAVALFFKSYSTASSRNDALRPLRAFVNWSLRMRYITAEDAAVITTRKQVAVERLPKHYIKAEEFPRMLDIAEEHSPHNRAVVAVALYTLCRVSEIDSLRLKDIDLIGGKIKVYRLKKKRYTTTVISPDLREELERWLAWYAETTGYQSPAAMMKAHPDWYLLPRFTHPKINIGGRFISAPDQRKLWPEMKAQELELVVKRVLHGLGVDGEQGFQRSNKGEGMHTIRRSGARALWLHLTNNVGHERAMAQVMKMLDHKDLKVTQRYVGMDLEKDELDAFLATNRMYGDLPSSGHGGQGNVVPIRTSAQTLPVIPEQLSSPPNAQVSTP